MRAVDAAALAAAAMPSAIAARGGAPLLLSVFSQSALLRIVASGHWGDGSAEASMRVTDIYEPRAMRMGPAARLLRMTRRALGHWGAAAARVGPFSAGNGSGGVGFIVGSTLGSNSDDETEAISGAGALGFAKTQTGAPPWVDALIARSRGPPRSAPLSVLGAITLPPYDPSGDTSDTDEAYWNEVTAVRALNVTIPLPSRGLKRLLRGDTTTTSTAEDTLESVARLTEIALRARAAISYGGGGGGGGDGAVAAVARRWAALGVDVAAELAPPASATLSPHLAAARTYDDVTSAGVSLRRAIGARLAQSPAPHGAAQWRLIASTFTAAEFETFERSGGGGDKEKGSAKTAAATSKLSREMQWRRDAALRESTSSIVTAITAAAAANLITSSSSRMTNYGPPPLSPMPPSCFPLPPPTVDAGAPVTLSGVTVISRALPTLRLKVWKAEAHTEE